MRPALILFAALVLIGCDGGSKPPPLDRSTPVAGVIPLQGLVNKSNTTDAEVLYGAGDSKQLLMRRSGQIVRWDYVQHEDDDVISGSTWITHGGVNFGCFWVIHTDTRRSSTSCLEGEELRQSLGGFDGPLNNVKAADATYEGHRTFAGVVAYCYTSSLITASGSVCLSGDGIVLFADLASRLGSPVFLSAIEIREKPTEADVLNAPIPGASGEFLSQREDVPLDVSLFPPVPMITDLAVR